MSSKKDKDSRNLWWMTITVMVIIGIVMSNELIILVGLSIMIVGSILTFISRSKESSKEK